MCISAFLGAGLGEGKNKCFSCMNICVSSVCLVPLEVLDPLELELWTVVHHKARAGNQTWSFGKQEQVFITAYLAISPAPFKKYKICYLSLAMSIYVLVGACGWQRQVLWKKMWILGTKPGLSSACLCPKALGLTMLSCSKDSLSQNHLSSTKNETK